MAAPDSWYGPSWSYFAQHNEPIVPAGGFGMGVCCVAIGALQLLSIWRSRWRWVSLFFFLSGFVLMTSGLLLFAEGFLGHRGLMEAPFMCTLAVHKFVISVNVFSRVQRV